MGKIKGSTAKDVYVYKYVKENNKLPDDFLYQKNMMIVYARIPSKLIDKMENICKNTIKGERA